MDLTQLFPQPIPVAIAGRRVLARPLRLRQLAELQAWLRAAAPDPAAVLEGLERLDEQSRRRALVRAYLAAESWPPAVGSREADCLLNTPAGRVYFLAVALREFNGELTGEDLEEMAGSEDVAGWRRLAAACYGADSLERIARAIERPAFRPDDGPADLGPVVAGLVADHGWTLEEAGELTIGQVAAIYSGGKREEPSYPPRPGETRDQANARRQAFFAIDDEGKGT